MHPGPTALGVRDPTPAPPLTAHEASSAGLSRIAYAAKHPEGRPGQLRRRAYADASWQPATKRATPLSWRAPLLQASRLQMRDVRAIVGDYITLVMDSDSS